MTDAILSAIRSCIPTSPDKPVGLHEPEFSGNEWKYVKECLDTGWVSSVGKFVDRFEKDLSDFTGVQRAVAVSNGTAALHIALKLAGVRENDEVLVPALTFVATANAVRYCFAHPHFVDSNEFSLGVDPQKLSSYLKENTLVKNGTCVNRNTGRTLRALVAMHTCGLPCDLDALVEICERHALVLIEDAAESLGSYYKKKHTGNWGLISTLSFNGNKTVTTGGGGAILTNNIELGQRAKHVTTTAKVPHPWAFEHDEVGYNYRLPNLNAALGCAQLELLPTFLERKRALHERYATAFSSVSGVKLVGEPKNTRSNFWLNTILLDSKDAGLRDSILERAHSEKILLRPSWKLMHTLPMFKSNPRMDLSVAEDLERRLIQLPSSSFLTRGRT